MDDRALKLGRIREIEEQLVVSERMKRLKTVKLLPSQRLFIESSIRPDLRTVIMTASNQCGKSFILAYTIFSMMEGIVYSLNRATAWRPPIKVALLLPDYDNHARKFLENYVYYFYDRSQVKVEQTQQGGPRQFTLQNNSLCRIFTHDQDVYRLAGDTFHLVAADEPCPRSHLIELQRGLSRWKGKTLMTMTPLSEPWIFDDIYSAASNMGGERKDIFSITAFPDENFKSHGGYLDDSEVLAFREGLTPEEREARVNGRWMHLLGRVYKSFDERIHVTSLDLAKPEDRCYGFTIDPHDRLPFAISFWYVTRDGTIVIHDEWPKTPFEEFSSCDLTIDDYSILLNEDNSNHLDQRVFWKVIDPNFGVKRAVVTGLSIAEEFQLRGHAFITDVVDDLTAGHRAVDDYLRWDKTKELSAINQPRLFIKNNCRNHIHSLKNYIWDEYKGRVAEGRSPKQKPKEKYKHFCDNIRYTVMVRPKFIDRSRYTNLNYPPR